MTRDSILVFVIVLSFESCKQIKPEISTATEMVEDAKRYVNREEAKIEANRIANEKELSNQLAFIIDESKAALLINSKNEIMRISNNLINLIVETILTIENTHGKDKNGHVLDKRESKYVNEVMLDKKMATQLKFAINNSIAITMKIISENQIQIQKKELPLSLNFFMESSGKTWEEYTFQNMPFGAAMPIFSKYKNDVILNKLLVLQELSKKVQN